MKRKIHKKGQNIAGNMLLLIGIVTTFIAVVIIFLSGARIPDDIGRSTGHINHAVGENPPRTTFIGNFTDDIGSGYQFIASQFGLFGNIVIISIILAILLGAFFATKISRSAR